MGSGAKMILRKKYIWLCVICITVFFTGCNSNLTTAEKKVEEELISSAEESNLVTKIEDNNIFDSSEDMPIPSQEIILEATAREQDASDDTVYDRTYLEKDGEEYVYRLTDAELIEKYNVLYEDAFESVVNSYNEIMSYRNQSYKSNQKGNVSNLVLKKNSKNKVIGTGSCFEIDCEFNLLNVGYTYVDLDSDGVFEIIFGILSYKYNDGLPMDIYERAFALSNGKVVKILEGGSRVNQWLGSDGHIYGFGSSGAAYGGISRLHFDKTELDGNDVGFGDIGFKEDEFLGYWEGPVHIVDPITDINEMAKLPEYRISDDELQKLESEWEAKRVKIEWLRMADYFDVN